MRRSATIEAINSADCVFARRPSLVRAKPMHARGSSVRAGVRSSSGSGNERASPITVYRRRAWRLEVPRSAPISMGNALRWPRTALSGATRTGEGPWHPPRRRPSAEGTSPARDRLASRRHLRLDRRVVSSPGGEYNAGGPLMVLIGPAWGALYCRLARLRAPCALKVVNSRQEHFQDRRGVRPVIADHQIHSRLLALQWRLTIDGGNWRQPDN